MRTRNEIFTNSVGFSQCIRSTEDALYSLTSALVTSVLAGAAILHIAAPRMHNNRNYANSRIVNLY